jgi:hypothetical protein
MAPTPIARFAAKELQTFIAKATGQTVAIVRRRTGVKAAIVLGDNRWARQAAWLALRYRR